MTTEIETDQLGAPEARTPTKLGEATVAGGIEPCETPLVEASLRADQAQSSRHHGVGLSEGARAVPSLPAPDGLGEATFPPAETLTRPAMSCESVGMDQDSRHVPLSAAVSSSLVGASPPPRGPQIATGAVGTPPCEILVAEATLRPDQAPSALRHEVDLAEGPEAAARLPAPKGSESTFPPAETVTGPAMSGQPAGADEGSPQVALPSAVASSVGAPPHSRDTSDHRSPADIPTLDVLSVLAGEILDKQYRLYGWNDTKAYSLITTNAALFAAVGFLYKECMQDALAMAFLGAAALLLAVSLIMCLFQVIPRISSGKSGGEVNIRSLQGIGRFPTWEDYLAAFSQVTLDRALSDAVRQIYGMSENNRRSARFIARGVSLTILGVTMVVAAMGASAGAARGYHVLGPWQVGPVAQAPGVSNAPSGSSNAPHQGTSGTADPTPTLGVVPSPNPSLKPTPSPMPTPGRTRRPPVSIGAPVPSPER